MATYVQPRKRYLALVSQLLALPEQHRREDDAAALVGPLRAVPRQGTQPHLPDVSQVSLADPPRLKCRSRKGGCRAEVVEVRLAT
jgi:hypothetical protein